MSTFDAPILPCERCGQYVLRDQTCDQCAAEHGCGDSPCPWADCFAPAQGADSDDSASGAS